VPCRHALVGWASWSSSLPRFHPGLRRLRTRHGRAEHLTVSVAPDHDAGGPGQARSLETSTGRLPCAGCQCPHIVVFVTREEQRRSGARLNRAGAPHLVGRQMTRPRRHRPPTTRGARCSRTSARWRHALWLVAVLLLVVCSSSSDAQERVRHAELLEVHGDVTSAKVKSVTIETNGNASGN